VYIGKRKTNHMPSMTKHTNEALDVGIVLIVAFLLVTGYMMWSTSYAHTNYCIVRCAPVHNKRKYTEHKHTCNQKAGLIGESNPTTESLMASDDKKSVHFGTVEHFPNGSARRTNNNSLMFDRITNATRSGLNSALHVLNQEEGFTPRRVNTQENQLRLIRLASTSRMAQPSTNGNNNRTQTTPTQRRMNSRQ
jgi:hypothetical protein